MPRRTLLAVAIVALVLAGCGSDDGDSTAATEDDATTTAATVTEPSDDQATETSQADSDAGASSGGETHGTVTLDGETHEFEFFDLGLCDTDYGGSGIFYAFLTNTDGSGETVTLTLVPEGDPNLESTLALISPAASWVGNPMLNPDSRVDSFDIDGNHAEGTATLFNEAGEGPVAATFDVTCG